MPTEIPHFKYYPANASNNYAACIKLDGKTIHQIANLDEFYKTFGYTHEISMAGVLPDEFIWSEYTNDAALDLAGCLQIRFIEYLDQYSDTFRELFGDLTNTWLAAHSEKKATGGAPCTGCTVKSSCKS